MTQFYYSVLIGFGALWGVPFLRTAYGFSEELAGFATSMVYLGFVCGGPFIGHLADHLKSRKTLLLSLSFFTLLSMCPAFYIANLPIWILFILIFMTGVFASGQILTYIVVIEANPIEVKATSTGFVNMFALIVGSILQPLMGWFLEIFWDGRKIKGIPFYSAQDYVIALTWIPILTAIAFLLIFFIREKKNLVTLKQP